jgi:starch phosphorylase
MKISIRQLCRYFTTHRMVGEYTERYYLPVAAHHQRMAEGAMAPAKILSAWKTRVSMAWPKIRINAVSADHIAEILVGTPFNVQAEVSLGELTPEDVTVQLFLGNVDGNGEIKEGQTSVMVMEKSTQHGMFLYNASVVISSGSGLYGYTVRVLPHHPELVTPFQPGLITWAITSSS